MHFWESCWLNQEPRTTLEMSGRTATVLELEYSGSHVDLRNPVFWRCVAYVFKASNRFIPVSWEFEVEGDTFRRNVGRKIYNEAVSRSRRLESSVLNLLAILRNCWRQEAASLFIGLQSVKQPQNSLLMFPHNILPLSSTSLAQGRYVAVFSLFLRPFHFVLSLSSRSPKHRVPIRSVLKI
jgi:hypothetical protein